MAEEGIMVSGSHVIRKAGSGANTLALSEGALNDFITQAESYVNVATRYNWSDNFGSANSDVKGCLKEAVSNLAAIYAIQSDLSGYSSIQEAQSKVDILHQRAMEVIVLLRDKKQETFMKGA